MSGPLTGLLIQSVGSDGAHLHPLARSVAAADGIPPSCVWGGGAYVERGEHILEGD